MVLNKNDLNRAFSPKLKQRKPLRSAVSSRDGTSSSSVKVLVRIRPLSEREQQQNLRVVVQRINDRLLIFDPKEDSDLHFFHDIKQNNRDITKKQHKHAQFSFDRVFDSNATNEDVYEESIKDVISSILQGYNCSVFVYGTTGAGKTYTMLGSKDNPGITYLTMKELYDQINNLESPADFSLGVCYLEVYNENVHDLINPSGPLHLREDGNRVMVAGTNILKVENADQLFDMLEKGNRNRTQHPTDANSESSRSHAVFQVYLRMVEKSSGEVRRVKLSMIDLAGSERGTSTGCKGIRFKEGSNINKSLLALGNCINSLADGRRHIPYRDSKLTRLLKDSLGSNCKTVMIANIAPSVFSYEDTYNTLKYASRAKEIKSALSKNIVKVNADITYYVRLNDELKKETETLKNELELMKKAKANSESSGLDPEYLQKLDEVYIEKAKIHKELLNLESLEKVLKWRINQKEAVAGQLSDNTIENEETKVLGRVEQAINQFNAQSVSLHSERAEIWNKYTRNEEKLNSLLRELEEKIVIKSYKYYIEAKQQMLDNIRLEVQVTHQQKLCSLVDKHYDSMNYCNSKMYKSLSKYYMLIRGLNKLTNEMESEYQDIVRMVASSMKGVTWKDEKIVSSHVAKLHPYMNLSFTQQIKETSPPNEGSSRNAENTGSTVVETVSEEQADTDMNSTFVFPLPKQEFNTNSVSKPVNGVTRGVTYLTGCRVPKINKYTANKENHVPVTNLMLPPHRMDRTILAPKQNQVLARVPQSASKVDIVSSKKIKDRPRSSSTYLLTTPSLKRLGYHQQKMKRLTPISVKSVQRYIASNKDILTK